MTAPNLSELLRGCTDPTRLMRLAGVEAPSPAIATTLRAMYASKPLPGDLAVWRTISRMPWPTSKPRRAVACVGRRGLKSSGLVAWSAVHELLCGSHDARAAPGSRVYATVICPFVPQARESVRGVRAALDALATLGVRYTMRDSAGAPEIVITNPRGRCEHVVRVMTADSVSVRGFAVAAAFYDECGFLPHEQTHATRDRDIVRALSPAMVQFPDALSMFVSSPGPPGSLFHSLVEKPPQGTVVVRGPSWVFNPRVTEAACLAECAGDSAAFEQEFAARRFGYAGESFITTSGILVGSPHAGQGPRPGSFVVALDAGQLVDSTALVVLSGFDVEVSPGHAPVRHVVVEHAETIESSRREPTPLEAIAGRATALSRAYGGAPILFDLFQGPTMKAAFAKLGYREFVDPTGERVPPLRAICQRSMAPQHQTPRWKLVRDLCHGGRLHVGAHDEELVRQLGALRATQMSTGALKVEGRKDDLADCLALGAPVAMKLAPTGGPAGAVEFVAGSLTWNEGGLVASGGQFMRIHPDGRREPAETPRWHPYFDEYAQEMVAQGIRTPAIMQWEQEQQSGGLPGVNVPMGDY
jgi:hypothetical protein